MSLKVKLFLLYEFDEAFEMVSLEIVMFLPHRVLPAVPIFVLAGWAGTTHSLIHIPPGRRLSRTVLRINLSISFGKHGLGHWCGAPLVPWP